MSMTGPRNMSRIEDLGMAQFSHLPAYHLSDPGGVTRLFSGALGVSGLLHRGMIVNYSPQAHSALVQVFDLQCFWPCAFADEPLSMSYGFSSARPPMEGEEVIVMEASPMSQCGIILGRKAHEQEFNGEDKYNDPEEYERRLYTQLDGTTPDKVTSMSEPLNDKFDCHTHVMAHFRATDMYPGEFAIANQHNCGIKGGMFSATLLGGGASVRASALTNCVRVSGESYQRYNLQGSVHEFHNGRYLSSERNHCLYQEERLGWWKPDSGDFSSNVWTRDSEAPKGGESQTLRPRVKELTGLFGNLVSRFCLRPDPDDKKIRVQGESKPDEAGVSRETIDPSGQYRVSAAGMIVIERTGRIPVPVRTAYPTDEKHDIEKQPEKLEPFEHKEGDPCYRQLELYDRQAYDLKTQYARVDGLGMDAPDYHVPQEESLKGKVKDKYDENFFGNETVKLEKYDDRRAGVYIGEDGSVIIRDAWGSEIVMCGGNVSISCAGNTMLLPGQTALTIAGDDIVQKAQNSVDIHASEHDVRLSAARNMEILGGADEDRHQGGVIIESRGSASQPWDGKDKGESAQLNGITLRSANQNVVVAAEKVSIRSNAETRLLSGRDELGGTVSVAANTFRTRTKESYLTTEGSVLGIGTDGLTAIGERIELCAGASANIYRGSKILVPLMWSDVEKNMAEEVGPALIRNTDGLKDDKAEDGYTSHALQNMVFCFRTPQECRTDKSWVIGAEGAFRMYEPAWIQVKNKFKTLKDKGVDVQKYKEEAKWGEGMPFPGKDSGAEYAKLGSGGPENLSGEGFNISRKLVKEKSSISEVRLDDGYQVRKQ